VVAPLQLRDYDFFFFTSSFSTAAAAFPDVDNGCGARDETVAFCAQPATTQGEVT
jgi:hypothetical protein